MAHGIMAGLMGEFESVMAQVIDAVQVALGGPIREGLMREIAKYAEENVYSYGAAPYFMAKRRHSLDDISKYEKTVGDLSLTIDGSGIALQLGVGGEVDIVETGAGWHQPGARPYMNEALENYVASGEADRALAMALAGMGFSASVG